MMLRLPLVSASLVLALFIFQSGFLLKRQEIHVNSKCEDAKINPSDCWMQKQHGKVVLIIVDALRYDFLLPVESNGSHFRGQMRQVKALIEKGAAIGTVLADPPTTTLQRIKALTTGTLPTFIDAGDNFSPGAQVLEDNWLSQAKSRGLNVSFYGDDTWIALYPSTFTRAEGFSSFDINDLNTVDDAVTDLLLKELRSEVSVSQLVIGHVLGVDHCGHKHGPAHPQMADTLRRMDALIGSAAESLGPEDLLLVLGDHGMTSSGDHGGDSDDETHAGFMVYSPSRALSLPSKPIRQIDIVPSISLLLGLPIPFSNLGTVIQDLFPETLKNQAVAVNYEQVVRFANTYASTHSFAELYDITSHEAYNTEEQLIAMQRIQHRLRSAWTQFDWPLMRTGLIGLAEATLFLLSQRQLDPPTIIVRSGCMLLQLSIVFGGAEENVAVPLLTVVLTLSIVYSFVSLLLSALSLRISSPTQVAAVIATLLHSISYLSNSYVVSEAKLLRFLLQTILVVAGVSRISSELNGRKRHAKVTFTALAKSKDCIWLLFSMLFLRLEPLFHRCREEESDCLSYYPVQLLGNLSPDAQFWRLASCWLVVGGLNWWLTSRVGVASVGSASLRVGVAMSRPAHLALFLHQMVQIAISNGRSEKFRLAANLLAQCVYLCSAISAGLAIYSSRRCGFRDCHALFVYAISWPLLMLLGEGLAPSLVGLGLLLVTIYRICPPDSVPWVVSVLIPFGFYLTGHSPTLTAIPWQAAFVGVPGNFWLQSVPAVLVLCHLCVSTLLSCLSLPLSPSASLHSLQSLVAASCLPFFSACLAAFLHRRHLMVWKIFAPRFIFESVSFLYLLIIANLLSVVLRRHIVKT